MRVLYWCLYLGTISLLLVGAQLQVLKAALVCPDWPLCYGEFLPTTMSPAFYESLHRFISGIILLGSLVWGIGRYSEIRIKAFLPLFLVIIQALLGLATFVYKLPTITTVLHLIFSMIFLASIEGTRILNFQKDLKNRWNPKLKDAVGFYLFLFLFQFILGGILRKSSLLAQCESTMEFWACWKLQSEIPLAGSLSLVHRILGLSISIGGFFIFSYLLKNLPRWKWMAVVGNLLLVIQLYLGLQMGRSSSRELIFWHFSIALFIFCLLVSLLVRLRRYEYFFFEKPLPTFLNDLIDLFKPKLTILVVITVLVGVFLAPMQMNVISLIASLSGIWFQAAGSLALNSYIEREEDKLMERTKDRPLPAGRIKPIVALYWGWGLIIFGSIILFLVANLLTSFLGIFAALSYLYLYTPLKLKTPYALYVGAIPGALPTLMGWTTVNGSLGSFGVYLFGVLFLWQVPHFMAISIYRKADYGRAKFLTFAQTHSINFLKLNIVLYSLFLMLITTLPYILGWRGEVYLWISFVPGVILLLISLAGIPLNNNHSVHTWARVYFFGTLFYLPIALGVLLIIR